MEEDYEKPLIFLARFNMIVPANALEKKIVTLAKKIVILPQRVEKGTLLVKQFGCNASTASYCSYKLLSKEVLGQFLDKDNLPQKALLDNSKINLQIVLFSETYESPGGPNFFTFVAYRIEDPQPSEK